MNIVQQIQKFKDHLKVLEAYLQTKISERDWHACWDVCVDIHNIESKIRLLESLLS